MMSKPNIYQQILALFEDFTGPITAEELLPLAHNACVCQQLSSLKFFLVQLVNDDRLVKLIDDDGTERYVRFYGDGAQSPLDPPAAAVITLPDSLLPAPPSYADLPDTTVTPREASVELARLKKADLGFDLLPYDANSTVIRVRELHRSLLASWLEMGAYLYRAQLVMGNKFWGWFDGQQFPFSRDWARQSISTVRLCLEDPELPKLCRRMRSVKAFQVVARRLAEPEGKAEFAAHGTVHGQSIESIESMRQREIAQLTRQGGESTDPQLKLLPDESIRQERDALAEKLQKAEEMLNQERAQLATQTRELMVARQQIARQADPELNREGITTDFVRDLHTTRQLVMLKVTELRPSRRRDLEGLSDSAVLELYSTLILIEKATHLALREVETRFGGRVPELLQDSEGQARAPMSRANLRILEEDMQETWEGVTAMAEGRPFTVIDSRTGEILSESPAS